jgi:uroporphyrinogen-III synthase
LLALPAFARPAGDAVLLVKGTGGRDLLSAELRARGADVLELEVYRRVTVTPGPVAVAALHAAFAGCGRLVVTVTSSEILRSLLEHAAPTDADTLRRLPLVVPGPRVALEAARVGWSGPIVEASTAEDDAIVAALLRLAAIGSPPAA